MLYGNAEELAARIKERIRQDPDCRPRCVKDEHNKDSVAEHRIDLDVAYKGHTYDVTLWVTLFD